MLKPRIVGFAVLLVLPIGVASAAGVSPAAYAARLIEADGNVRRIAPPRTAPARASTHASAAEAWQDFGPDGADIMDIAASPTEPATLLAVTVPSSFGFTLPLQLWPHSGMYRSIDAAAHWAPVAAFEGLNAWGLAFAGDGTAYVATDDSLWTSADQGLNWRQLDIGVGAVARVASVSLSPGDDAKLWACVGSNGGNNASVVIASADRGATWADRTPPAGPAFAECSAVAIDPADPDRIVVVMSDEANQVGYAFRSDDAGQTWTDISAGLPGPRLYAAAFAGARVLVGGGFSTGDDVGVYASDDLGAHWLALSDPSWPLLNISRIAVDPNDPHNLLVATWQRGVNRSSDGGATWDLEVPGTEHRFVNAVRFAPNDSTQALLGTMALGAAVSGDGGASFVRASAGLRELGTASIAVNPNDADELAVAFQTAYNGGVYTSLDHGASWNLEALPPTRFSYVAFSPTGVLHAISIGPTSSTVQEGVYRRNADSSWTNLGPDQGTRFESNLDVLGFSADDPNLIFAGDQDFGIAGFAGTIWRSADAGAT